MGISNLAIIYLGLTGFLSADEPCSAQVEVESLGPETELVWAIDFGVDVEGCSWSSGSFDFEMVVVDKKGIRQTLERSESWIQNDSSKNTTRHRIQLSKGESVDEVEVLEKTVKCTCRGKAAEQLAAP